MHHAYRSATCFGGKTGDTSFAGRTPWEAVVHADSNPRKHPKAGEKDRGHGGLNVRVGTQ